MGRINRGHTIKIYITTKKMKKIITTLLLITIISSAFAQVVHQAAGMPINYLYAKYTGSRANAYQMAYEFGADTTTVTWYPLTHEFDFFGVGCFPGNWILLDPSQTPTFGVPPTVCDSSFIWRVTNFSIIKRLDPYCDSIIGYYPTTSQANSSYATISHTHTFASLTSKPTTLSGYGITNAYPLSGNPSGFLTSEVDGSVTNEIELPTQTGQNGKILSTNGTTPSWISPPTGTVTSVGVSSTDFSVSGSPVTSSGSMTLNLNTSGVSSGFYDWVTVNSKGIVTAAGNMATPIAIASGARNFNQAYQVSTTSQSHISVSPQLSCSLSLSGGTSGTIVLEISANGSTGWIFQGEISGSNTGTLTIGLNTTQITGGQMTADLPAGYYWRLTTTNVTGTPTYTFNGGYYTTY